MAYLNIHMSLGWVGDERVVSVELPEQWDIYADIEKERWKEEAVQDALNCSVDSWTTESEEPEADEW